MFRLLAVFLVLTSLASAAPVPPVDNRASAEALNQAVEVLEKAKGDALDRAQVWCEVAALRHKLGDRNGAADALRKALVVTGDGPRFPDIQQRSRIAVFNMGHRMELYVSQEIAQSIIDISKSFNVDAKIIGRVEAFEGKQVSISSEYGEFKYN